MADNQPPVYEPDFDFSDNPYANYGMARRPYYTDPNAKVVDNTSEFGRSVRSAALNFKANLTEALLGLARQLMGDQAGAMRNYEEYERQTQLARSLGPRVQDLSQIENPMDAALWAMNLGVHAAPDIAMSMTGAGAGVSAARFAATQTAKGMARKHIQRSMREHGMDRLRNRQILENARRNTTQAADARVHRAQFMDAIDDRAAELAARAGGKMRGRFERMGSMAGAGIGQYPGMTADSVDALKQTDQTGAWSIASTDAIASLVGGLPADRLVGRMLGRGLNQQAQEAISTSAREYLRKAGRNITKEALAQGAAEGTLGVAQAAIQLAGHDFVLGNVDLLGEDALNRYLAEFIGGVLRLEK